MLAAGLILVVLVGIPWGKEELSKRLTISLREAARAGDWDRLSRVVALGADVNEPETWSFGGSYRRTALMYAALSGRVDMVATLLQAGADVTLATSQDSATALLLAMDNGHDDVVELLLAAGAQS